MNRLRLAATSYTMGIMDFAAGPPCDEDVWALIREHGMARDWMLSGRPYELDHEAGRVVYMSPAGQALAGFMDTVETSPTGSRW